MTVRWAAASMAVTAIAIRGHMASPPTTSHAISAARTRSQPQPARAVQYRIARGLTRWRGGRRSGVVTRPEHHTRARRLAPPRSLANKAAARRAKIAGDLAALPGAHD